MANTSWEHRKAMSDRIFGVWDAKRESLPIGWEATFEAARTAVLRRLEQDHDAVRQMTFEEFCRIQKVPGVGQATGMQAAAEVQP